MDSDGFRSIKTFENRILPMPVFGSKCLHVPVPKSLSECPISPSPIFVSQTRATGRSIERPDSVHLYCSWRIAQFQKLASYFEIEFSGDLDVLIKKSLRRGQSVRNDNDCSTFLRSWIQGSAYFLATSALIFSIISLAPVLPGFSSRDFS